MSGPRGEADLVAGGADDEAGAATLGTLGAAAFGDVLLGRLGAVTAVFSGAERAPGLTVERTPGPKVFVGAAVLLSKRGGAKAGLGLAALPRCLGVES